MAVLRHSGCQRPHNGHSSDPSVLGFTSHEPGNQKELRALALLACARGTQVTGKKMARADDYARYAAECVRVAQKTPNARDKALLLDMAQRWRELAEKAEKREQSRKA
jgi:hypothetical protein